MREKPGALPSTGNTYDPRRATGFSHEQLVQAFDRVQDPNDWRGPIRAEIPAAMRSLVEKAIVWFTATAPAFVRTDRPGVLLATAPGYLRGPWGRPDRHPESGSPTRPPDRGHSPEGKTPRASGRRHRSAPAHHEVESDGQLPGRAVVGGEPELAKRMDSTLE